MLLYLLGKFSYVEITRGQASLFSLLFRKQVKNTFEKDNMQKTSYHSFLLRLWYVKHNGKFSWRASLEDPHTDKQRFFDSLEELFTFIQTIKQTLEDNQQA